MRASLRLHCAPAGRRLLVTASILIGPLSAAPANDDAMLQALIKAAKSEGSLMIYHTSPFPIIGPTFRGFEKKYGIKIQNFHATGNALTVRFSSEAAANRPLADVFYASEATAFERYQSLFQRLTPDNFPYLARIPQAARMSNGVALAPTQTSFSLIYNTKRVAKGTEPRTWNDIADPKWKGTAMLVDPRSSATYRVAFNAIRKMRPGLLPKIKSLDPRLVETGTPAAQQIAAGTAAFAFPAYPTHATPLMAKGAPIQWATIEDPELTRNGWVGAVNGSRNPNAARLFVNFFMSDEGVALYCKASAGSKSAIDPTGKRTGCEPLASDVVFLPDSLSAQDSAEVVKQLGLQ